MGSPLENAVELMLDAAVLVEAGRPRRGYALGVIAVEEVAKHYRCRSVLHGWTGEITVVELNSKLRPPRDAHVERFAETLIHIGALAPSAPMPPGFEDSRRSRGTTWICAIAPSMWRSRRMASP